MAHPQGASAECHQAGRVGATVSKELERGGLLLIGKQIFNTLWKPRGNHGLADLFGTVIFVNI